MQGLSKDQRISLGVLGKPFGIKGYISVHYYGEQENIKNFTKLYVENDGYLEVQDILIRNKKISIKFKDIDSRTEVELLKNKEISVLETELPNLEKGEFYWFQLEGLKVINEQAEILGEISHMMKTGANDVMVVRHLKESIDVKERLIPFLKKETVVGVDLIKKEVFVKWPKDF